MATRQYSSFLIRLWSAGEAETGATAHPLVLQIQHLQTGLTWRLESLEELNKILTDSLAHDTQKRLNSPGAEAVE